MKTYLSIAAAVAALAFTTSVAFADSAPGEKVNSTVPGSPGYTGAAQLKKPHNKRTVTEKSLGVKKSKAKGPKMAASPAAK